MRYFDTARNYENGRAEQYYGQFLTPKYREHVFLSTKSASHDAASARRDLEASLAALKTDHLDLWLMHSVNDRPDADARLRNGVVDEFLKAKAEGKSALHRILGAREPGHAPVFPRPAPAASARNSIRCRCR